MVLAALLAAAYGFAQYFGFDPWINPELYHTGEGEWQIARPPSTLGHAIHFAVFCLLAMFCATGLALSGSTPGARLGWGASALVLAMALIISGSRGAWLGAAVGTVVLGARLGSRRRLLAGLLATTVLAAVFVVSPLGRQVRSRFRSFVEDPGATARAWPEVEIRVRADSGFCREPLMAWCEAEQVHYVLGMAKNERLVEQIEAELEQAKQQFAQTGKAARVFQDFRYRTRQSGSRPRRVVAKPSIWTKAPIRALW